MSNALIAVLGGTMGMIGYGSADFFAKKTIEKLGILKSVFYSQFLSIFFLLFFLFQDASIPTFTIGVIGAVIIFGFFWATGYLSLYRAFEVGKLSVVSPITSTFAVLAAVISYLFFHEPFSSLKIAAVALVTVGVVLTAINLKELRNGIQWKDLAKGVPEALAVFFIFGFFWPLWDQFVGKGAWVILTIAMRIVAVTVFFLYAQLLKKQSLSLSQLPLTSSVDSLQFHSLRRLQLEG